MSTISYFSNFKFAQPYYRQKELARLFAISTRVIDRWIVEEKDKGKNIPGRMKFKGSRSYIWNPIPFHQWLFKEKLPSPARNEYELAENKAIMDNLEKEKIRNRIMF